jgi:hypothetical protein
MAIINKTGITTGGTIEAEHVTRAIDALSGGSTDTVVATGSFQGTLSGTATTASYVLNAVSSSFATTASFALNASGTGFPYTGSAIITGSLSVTGSFSQRSNTGGSFFNSNPSTGIITLTLGTLYLTGSSVISASRDSIINLGGIDSDKGALAIPVSTLGTKPLTGSMYFDPTGPTLYIYDGTNWRGWSNDF